MSFIWNLCVIDWPPGGDFINLGNLYTYFTFFFIKFYAGDFNMARIHPDLEMNISIYLFKSIIKLNTDYFSHKNATCLNRGWSFLSRSVKKYLFIFRT